MLRFTRHGNVVILGVLAIGLMVASMTIVTPLALAFVQQNNSYTAGVGVSAAAQLSSTVSNQPTSTTPVIVTMNSNDYINPGITHSNTSNTGDVIVNEDATYLIIAAGQVGKTSGNTTCNVDMWLRQNGTDVANSNTRASVVSKDDTTVLVSQAILLLKKGDKINTMISVSATDQGCGLINTTPAGEPNIPAIIFSIAKISSSSEGSVSSGR